MLTLVTLLYGIIEGPTRGWSDPVIVGAFVIGVLLLAAFITWEAHSDHPMLDVSFFKNPRFSAASAAITLVFFSMFGALFFMSQYLQFVLGYDALVVGCTTLARSVRPRHCRAAEFVARRTHRHEVRRHRRPRARCVRDVDLLARDDHFGLWPGRARPVHPRCRHGIRDGARDRFDHGLAPAGEGRRWLGGERHNPRSRRRARRRDPREHHGVVVPVVDQRVARLQSGCRGVARRGRRDQGLRWRCRRSGRPDPCEPRDIGHGRGEHRVRRRTHAHRCDRRRDRAGRRARGLDLPAGAAARRGRRHRRHQRHRGRDRATSSRRTASSRRDRCGSATARRSRVLESDVQRRRDEVGREYRDTRTLLGFARSTWWSTR